jgi:hypothetical protein
VSNGDGPNEAMVQAISSAYYGKEIGAAESARERAQRSYTIAGAVATTLLAAGVFTDIASQSTIVKIAGVVTLVAWVVVAVLFTRAIASPIKRIEDANPSDAAAFSRLALTKAREERDKIDELLGDAQIAAALASLATITTLLLAFFLPADRSDVTMTLTDRGMAAVDEACPERVDGGPLRASLVLSSLEDDFVTAKLEPGVCDSHETELRLPRDDVLAVDP